MAGGTRGDCRALVLALRAAAFLAAGDGARAAGRPARSGGPRCHRRRAAHRDRLWPLPGGHQGQRRLRERAGKAPRHAGDGTDQADLIAARRGLPRRLHWPERCAAGPWPRRSFVLLQVFVLVLGLAALVATGNLLAAVPAAVAARTRPAAALRTE